MKKVTAEELGKIFIDAAQEINMYAKHDIQKIAQLTLKQMSVEWKDMFDRCITDFYNAYHPMFYKRTDSLYKAYRVSTYGNKIIAHFGSFYMPHTHRVNINYIYQYVFLKGWHGGATKGKDHPEPGIPWWRTPPPFLAQKQGVDPWSRWGGIAYSSSSPYNQIGNAFDEYKKSQRGEAILNKYFTEIIKNKYKIFKLASKQI